MRRRAISADERVSAPITVVDPGERLTMLVELPDVGDLVVIFARARFREARVVKRTPTRVLCAYGTPSNPFQVQRQYRRVDEHWFDRVFVRDESGRYSVYADPRVARCGHDLAGAGGERVYPDGSIAAGAS